jgi:hypothetical protein
VRGSLALQHTAGWPLPPFVVILAHPWEFERTAGVSHSSEDNFTRLEKYLAALCDRFPVHFTTVSGLIART